MTNVLICAPPETERAPRRKLLEEHHRKVAKRVQSQMAARAIEIERKQQDDDRRLQERCLALMQDGLTLSRLSEDHLQRQQVCRLRRIGDRHRQRWDGAAEVGAGMANKRLSGCGVQRLSAQARAFEDMAALLELDARNKPRPEAGRRFRSVAAQGRLSPAEDEQVQEEGLLC